MLLPAPLPGWHRLKGVLSHSLSAFSLKKSRRSLAGRMCTMLLPSVESENSCTLWELGRWRVTEPDGTTTKSQQSCQKLILQFLTATRQISLHRKHDYNGRHEAKNCQNRCERSFRACPGRLLTCILNLFKGCCHRGRHPDDVCPPQHLNAHHPVSCTSGSLQ
jgi:hypothetical protein